MNANSDASGNALFGMITVQADSCLNSEQIDTLIISVGVQEGGFGGGGAIWAGGQKNAHDCQEYFFAASYQNHTFISLYIYGVRYNVQYF